MAELRTDGGHTLMIAALEKLADKADEANTQQHGDWADPANEHYRRHAASAVHHAKTTRRQGLLRRPSGNVGSQDK